LKAIHNRGRGEMKEIPYLEPKNWIVDDLPRYKSCNHNSGSLERLGLRLDEISKEKKITYQDLADLLNIDYSYLLQLIAGNERVPLSIVKRIKKQIPEINPLWLILGMDDMTNKEEIKINQSYSLEEVLEGLFKDYFSIEYDLVQNGDSLLEMSPGKRGIVLFQLFLQLSNSDTPILIDQPEDNLDNRTIYQELNTFIKNRKLKRQIILVSHNANLVVSTDSENVIVANQEIKKGNNYEYNEKYKFEYINGALEETFNNGKKFHEKGIREHVCEILEGGEKAFKIREKKYGF